MRFGLATLGIALLLAGCTGSTSEEEAAVDEGELRSRAVDEMSLSIYDSATTRFPRQVSIKFRGTTERQVFARCHEYRTSLDDSELNLARWAWVCRDDKLEVTVESTYGTEWKRFARVRQIDGGAAQFLHCQQTARQEAGGESWDSRTDHVCTPRAVDAYGKLLFDELDKAPVLEKYPTRAPFLQTLWTKSPPEKWTKYAAELARAMPVGEYVGFGRTTARKCKVRVVAEGDGLRVSMHSIDAAGAERLRTQVVVSSAMTFGATRFDDVDQNFGRDRPASVIVASSESETGTREHFQRNLKVIRFKDAPASVDAGHSAIVIDDDYCQRLDPPIPAW